VSIALEGIVVSLFTKAEQDGIGWMAHEQRTFKRRGDMELKMEPIEIPEGCNVLFGQSHFIKTVEDLYEILVGAVPGAKFGIGFCEASGHCLVRGEGNDEALKDLALKTAYRIGAGHTFIIFIKDAFPINMLNAVKMCQEVCNLFCATANPVEVVLAQSEQGRGVLGVIDGSSPKGVGKEDDVAWRKDLLRKFKYKLETAGAIAGSRSWRMQKGQPSRCPWKGSALWNSERFMPGPAPVPFWGISVRR